MCPNRSSVQSSLRLLSPWVALVLLAALPLAADTTVTGDLPRTADLGFATGEQDGDLVVRRLDPASAAARAGLEEGDVVVAVAGAPFDAPYVGQDLLRRLDGDVAATLTVRKADATVDVTFTPPPLPLEALPGLETTYGVVTTPDGSRLRSILTRPEGATASLPTLFFVQWVSCDGIELLDTAGRPWLEVIEGVAQRSGMVLIRVERASAGDSEGPGCHQFDFDTELAHYRHAFGELTRHPWVDRDRVVIWGNSLGGRFAPLVARGNRVAGVIAAGGGALTYFERMLEFDRIGFERGETDPREIEDHLREHAEFHAEYLLRGREPAEIVAERPQLAGVWGRIRGSGDGVHYGRPFAYHQQAARHDVLEAWVEVEAPVLVLYSGYDQFETARGHRLIADTLNRLRPGTARYVELPQVGHSYNVFPSAAHAARWSAGQPAAELAVVPILDWLREVMGVEPAEE